MVLTDREIQAAIEHGHIIIDPPPLPTAFSSTSLDLALSKDLRKWEKPKTGGIEQIICPADKDFKFTEFRTHYSQKIEIAADGYIVEPGDFVLATTQEYIQLPIYSRVAARVEGKSSLARLGIGVHVTAPTIHAGFEGTIQLEICNHGPLKVKLRENMPVCQLIFEQTLGTPAKGYTGQFFGQKHQ
jgi:dCTP deaminase